MDLSLSQCSDLEQLEDYSIQEYLSDPDHLVIVFLAANQGPMSNCSKKSRLQKEAQDLTNVYQECVANADGSRRFLGPYQKINLGVGDVYVNQGRLFDVLRINTTQIIFVSHTNTILPAMASRNVLQQNQDSLVSGWHCQEGTSRPVSWVSNQPEFVENDRVLTERVSFRTVRQHNRPLDVWTPHPTVPIVQFRLGDAIVSELQSPAKNFNSIEFETLQDRPEEQTQERRQRLRRFDELQRLHEKIMQRSYETVYTHLLNHMSQFLGTFTNEQEDWFTGTFQGHKWTLRLNNKTKLSCAQAIDEFGTQLPYDARRLVRTYLNQVPSRLEETPFSSEVEALHEQWPDPLNFAQEIHRRITLPMRSWQTAWTLVGPRMSVVQRAKESLKELETQGPLEQSTALATIKTELEIALGPLQDFVADNEMYLFQFTAEDFQTRNVPKIFRKSLKARLIFLHLKADIPN